MTDPHSHLGLANPRTRAQHIVDAHTYTSHKQHVRAFVHSKNLENINTLTLEENE